MTSREWAHKLRKKLRKILPDWVNFQNLIFITVILAFAIIVFWSESLSEHLQAARLQGIKITSTPTVLPGTPTPLPAELLASADQTNGILLGAIVIIFTIIVGTVVMILRDSTK